MSHTKCLSCFTMLGEFLEVSGCFGNVVEINCSPGERINILGDFYGLSVTSNSCVYNSGDNFCVITSPPHRSLVRRQCNGKMTCKYEIRKKKTCANGSRRQTNYQQIKYRCIYGKRK